MKYNKVGDLCRCQITGWRGRGPWSLCYKWVYYFISNGTPFKHEMNEMNLHLRMLFLEVDGKWTAYNSEVKEISGF